jgi:hypothetical protein
VDAVDAAVVQARAVAATYATLREERRRLVGQTSSTIYLFIFLCHCVPKQHSTQPFFYSSTSSVYGIPFCAAARIRACVCVC